MFSVIRDLKRCWTQCAVNQQEFNKLLLDLEEQTKKVAAAELAAKEAQTKGTQAWARAEAKRKNELAMVTNTQRKLEWDNFDLKNYRPPVEVKCYAAGMFLCSGKVEAPIKHITGITIGGLGKEPTGEWYTAWQSNRYNQILDTEHGKWGLHRYHCQKQDAHIVIHMGSSINYIVACHPKALDLLLARLNKAWKDGV